MKIIFAGTPDFAATCLTGLLDFLDPSQQNATDPQHEIVAVYTQPDRPAGRGRKVQISPVKQLALDSGIPCEQPLSLKDEQALQQLQSYQADIMIVVAYGLILPETVLNSFPHGCINVHASLLPRWRGAAPIQRAIAAGDPTTGITIMQMDRGLDTGDMLLIQTLPISDSETGGSLHDKLATMGAQLLTQTFIAIENNTLTATPQMDADATYAHKLSKQEAEINWHLNSQIIHNQIRAFNPWPVCFSKIQDKRIRIWHSELLKNNQTTNCDPGTIIHIDKQGIDIATGDGSIRLTELQLPGAKRVSCASLINGHHDWLEVGFKLG